MSNGYLVVGSLRLSREDICTLGHSKWAKNFHLAKWDAIGSAWVVGVKANGPILVEFSLSTHHGLEGFGRGFGP